MEKPKISETVFEQFIKKDYTNKIKSKLYCGDTEQKSDDINKIVIFFNYCFYTKNGFFSDKFNKSFIKDLSLFYHNIKTNILTDGKVFTSVNDFINLDKNNDVKLYNLFKFILKQYLYKFDKLKDEKNALTNVVSDRDILRILSYFQ